MLLTMRFICGANLEFQGTSKNEILNTFELQIDELYSK